MIKKNLIKSYLFLCLVFISTRLIYYYYFNIEFDTWTLKYYWQYFPKNLLENELVQSIIYNHAQPPLMNILIGMFMKISNNYILFIQVTYLVLSLINFIFFYKLLTKLKIKNSISFSLTVFLMILPTTVLYENHLYKDHLVMCFLTILIYFTLKIIKKPTISNYCIFAFFLSLLLLLRETFHIFWGIALIFFIFYINKRLKENLICLAIVILLVSPFYFKNLFLFNKFGLNLAMFEGLSQKIEYVKDMKRYNAHEKIKIKIFKNEENFNKLMTKMSKLYDIPLNANTKTYIKVLNYKNQYDASILNSDSFFNEVYTAIEPYRKKDLQNIILNYPEVFLITISNSLVRHFFRSSDTFYFVRFNSDKMPKLIKISHCIKLTLACIHEFNFKKIKFKLDDKFFYKIDDTQFNYLDKIKFSLYDYNFLILFIYFYVFFNFFKNFLNISFYDNFDYTRKVINFWIFTFSLIFAILIIFEDGELPRHRYSFDYLMLAFGIYYFNENKKIKKLQNVKRKN